MVSPSSFPLSPFEEKARNHAHIAFFGFFFALPLGMISARYLRTFTGRWLLPHMIINFVIAAPLIFAGFALGHQTTTMSGLPHYKDPHQRVGLALLILYLLQVFLGAFIHWIKIPKRFSHLGGRRPQNFLHVTIGLAILILATWQTHYGLYTEWALITGNIHPVSNGCKHFWLAILVVMWSVYLGGYLLLPRQIGQERAARAPKKLNNTKMEGYRASGSESPLATA